MADLSFFTGFFNKKRAEQALRGKDDKERFIQRYKAFRDLLKYNNEVLLVMADMQEKASGVFVFDKAYVESSYKSVGEGVQKIVEHLNILSDGRYGQLEFSYRAIDASIRELLTPKIHIPKADYVINLKDVTKDDMAVAGGKLSQLGEVASLGGLDLPPGFVVSTSAYQAFLEHNGIAGKINEKISHMDFRDYEALEHASQEMQGWIRDGDIPAKLSDAIAAGCEALRAETGQDKVFVSVRSSAIQEDVVFSFAGQYETVLNVGPENILEEYKNVLASQFTARALFYFMEKELDLQHMAMAVGILAMVDAKSSGILYTRDPYNPEAEESLINAVWGLGPYVVAGVVPTDKYRVKDGQAVEYDKGAFQDVMLKATETGGVADVPVPEALRDTPRLSKSQIAYLVACGRKLEKHFGRPQDIEWVTDPQDRLFLLQSRPLRMAQAQAESGKITVGGVKGHRVLLDKGSIASKGVGTGPVFIARSEKDLSNFPEGAVLVIRHTYPEFASALDKAAALVADIGSNLGHLATVARESNVPALFDTEKATAVLKNGEQVTVDAIYANVYAGVVTELLKENEAQSTFEETPALKKLREILALITPLNLTDPRAPGFSPKFCKTLHDITRYAHEVSLQAIFNASKESHFAENSTRQLVGAGVPMQWWVIDLEDGVKPGVKGKKVKLEDIVSVPLKALWDGMTAVPWEGPPPVDAKGFLSVMFSATTDPSIDPAVGKQFAEKNYILVSKNFCNVSTRLGFHFSTIEAFVGEVENQNYVTFSYSGGGAESARKNRRAKLISGILDLFDFRVEVRAETVFARVEGYNRAYLEEKMKVLGYIIVHTRQMDMVMHNDAMIDWYRKDLLKGMAKVVSVPDGEAVV